MIFYSRPFQRAADIYDWWLMERSRREGYKTESDAISWMYWLGTKMAPSFTANRMFRQITRWNNLNGG